MNWSQVLSPDTAWQDAYPVRYQESTMFTIKVRAKGKKRWAFLTSKGGTNYLRIHAAQFETREKAH